MNPGVTRGVPMGVLGFVLGAGIVVGLRLLQDLEPIWDNGPIFVLGTFLSAGFFVWGMGAFDPKLSEHGEEHEHEDADTEETAEEEAPPLALLGNGIWQSTFWMLVIAVVVGIFAFVTTDLGRITVDTDKGSVFESDVVTLGILGEDIILEQNALFVVFVVFTVFSMAIAAGIIALTVLALSRGLAETQGEPSLEDRTPPKLIQIVGGGPAGLLVKIIRWLPRLVQR